MIRLAQSFFHRFGIDVRRFDDPWTKDTEFVRLYAQVRPNTLVSPEKAFLLFQFARRAAALEGEIAEVGVYKGGTARLLASACPSKTVHLFDTFSGMPAVAAGIDEHRKGDFGDSSLDAVRQFLSGCPNAALHPGFFPATAVPVEGKRFALVHIDVDIYPSTKDCLEFFYPRVVPGGAILIDDYGWAHCPGVEKAVAEFVRARPEAAPVVIAKEQCAIFKN